MGLILSPRYRYAHEIVSTLKKHPHLVLWDIDADIKLTCDNISNLYIYERIGFRLKNKNLIKLLPFNYNKK